jgi:hypothetical protein
MENVTEALMMAFGVLIFVLALSISISSFSLAKTATDEILETRDRETTYTYVDYVDANGDLETKRIVGAETIVPALYRAYKEDYVVKFVFTTESSSNIYSIRQQTANGTYQYVPTNVIDLKETVIGTPSRATEFIEDLLSGNLQTYIDKYKLNNIFKTETLSNGSFYDKISSKKFYETSGLYYMEDANISGSTNTDVQDDTNKTEKRIITYTEI